MRRQPRDGRVHVGTDLRRELVMDTYVPRYIARQESIAAWVTSAREREREKGHSDD